MSCALIAKLRAAKPGQLVEIPDGVSSGELLRLVALAKLSRRTAEHASRSHRPSLAARRAVLRQLSGTGLACASVPGLRPMRECGSDTTLLSPTESRRTHSTGPARNPAAVGSTPVSAPSDVALAWAESELEVLRLWSRPARPAPIPPTDSPTRRTARSVLARALDAVASGLAKAAARIRKPRFLIPAARSLPQ